MTLKPVPTSTYSPRRQLDTLPLRNRDTAHPRVGQILGIKPQEFMDALAVVLASGCAFLISPTSDGGAVSVTIYVGDQRMRDYAASAEELSDTLRLVRDVAEAHMVGGPSKGPNGRPGASSSK